MRTRALSWLTDVSCHVSIRFLTSRARVSKSLQLPSMWVDNAKQVRVENHSGWVASVIEKWGTWRQKRMWDRRRWFRPYTLNEADNQRLPKASRLKCTVNGRIQHALGLMPSESLAERFPPHEATKRSLAHGQAGPSPPGHLAHFSSTDDNYRKFAWSLTSPTMAVL